MLSQLSALIASLCVSGSVLGAGQTPCQTLEAFVQEGSFNVRAAQTMEHQRKAEFPLDLAPVFEEILTEVKPEIAVEPKSEADFLVNVEQIIFRLVNEERQKHGLPALSYSTVMEKYARQKSQDMGDREYFGHGNPEGQLVQSLLDAEGVPYTVWGENLAMLGGYELEDEALAQMFMTNWMNSPSHRDNILSPDFEQVGVGVYQVGNRFYATKEFMR